MPCDLKEAPRPPPKPRSVRDWERKKARAGASKYKRVNAKMRIPDEEL